MRILRKIIIYFTGDYMFDLIKNYVSGMSITDVDLYLKRNNIILSSEELEFTYRFIKRNFEALYANPNVDLTRYKTHYTENNFNKIMKLVNDAKIKYAKFL